MDNEDHEPPETPDTAKDRFDAIKGIVGPVVFFACWIYMVIAYGFFFGIAMGWVAALAVAATVVFLLPHGMRFGRRLWDRLHDTTKRDR